jgi:hypothetical protein
VGLSQSIQSQSPQLHISGNLFDGLIELYKEAIPWAIGLVAPELDVAEEGITLYRGVDALHPGYANALEGIANPIGGDATALQHVLGNTASEFTSWTSDFGVAEGFATQQSGSGVVLSNTFSRSLLIPSPGNALGLGESEFLVPGPVTGSGITRVPAW